VKNIESSMSNTILSVAKKIPSETFVTFRDGVCVPNLSSPASKLCGEIEGTDGQHLYVHVAKF